jgi:purine-nucleoside phosphorylase
LNFAPVADYGLLAAAHAAATRRAIPTRVGGIYSSDTFYDERQDLSDELQRHNCLCVEMEAAELYTLAARYGRRALAILTISDHILTHEALPSDQRERSFGDMVQIALEAAFA